MKRAISILAFNFCSMLGIHAQTPFLTMDSININNITAAELVHGDTWYNPAYPGPPYYVSCSNYCVLHDSLTKNISGMGSFWMSGYDSSNQLHIAAQINRYTGIDYWPGPFDLGDSCSYTNSQNWNKIWKVNESDIITFLALTTHTISNTPFSILSWPGQGNIYAQGNSTYLTITNPMAPFVDLNGNGIYEPLLGEYPKIKGDQALWWVFNDNGATHNQTKGNPLGVEIHVMAYGYKRGTLIDNVIYYEYEIANHSPYNYANCRVAQMDITCAGTSLTNYIGFDSVWRMGIAYSGENGFRPCGSPPNLPWTASPMAAVTMIVLPGDTSITYVPAGSFTYFVNDESIIGIPTVDTQFNNYMRAKIRNGTHISDDFVGPGTQTKGYGAGPDCNYVFTGDPAVDSQWSECVCYNNPGFRNFILSSNDFTLNANSSVKLVFALIATDSLAGGCPVAQFTGIRIVADTAWGNYFNPPPQLEVQNIIPAQHFEIAPNPASSLIYIKSDLQINSVELYNIVGQKILEKAPNSNQTELDLSALNSGVYMVRMNGCYVRKIIKQ